ncbi:hypothetical protein LIER_15995 [Lithospermum erythrorhizon]|uniref:Uncharacterized protein n=1 Tax=Lithospermum erythrorhizon TaxID=34254 RepID=A0AAV3Q6W2_LITER
MLHIQKASDGSREKGGNNPGRRQSLFQPHNPHYRPAQPTEVKVPADFWESKLIPGKAWANYSDDEDYEAFHVCVEVDDNSTTTEALRVSTPASSSLQTFTITFTNGDLP